MFGTMPVSTVDRSHQTMAPAAKFATRIALHTPTVDALWRPRSRRRTNRHTGPTRRVRVTELMERDLPRPWSGRELAEHIGVKPRNMLTQLAEWTRLGFLTRTSAGAYALQTRRNAKGP
jgi:transcriptional regulator GlxA family with amidase domain